MVEPPDAVTRLMAALAAHRAWEEQPDEDPEAFLARHEDLRDLLEPMLCGDSEATDSEPAEQTLGNYRIQRELGRGAMGVVFLAWHPDLRREVALKVLPSHLSLNPHAVARFQREASAMARLDHPGIVSVFEVGKDRGQHFFAMEFLRGKTLHLVLDEQRAIGGDDESWRRRVVGWGIQLCTALSYAHSRGVLHRDLKPANVMVEAENRVVLTDFGLARLEELGGPALTSDGQFAGTPYYCSPEQAAGRWDDVGPPADVFSLGVTLYELLALERPFDGDTGHEVLHAIAHDEPRQLTKAAVGVSRDLAAVVHKAIAKDPLQRYASAAALGADLQGVLDRRPVTARQASTGQRIARWARREPVRAALTLVLALGIPVLSALVGYVYANADAVAAGHRTLREQAIEEQLDRGYALLAESRLGEAYDAFANLVIAEGALTEALAGELLVLGELLDPAPLKAWCRRWAAVLAEHPVLHQVSEDLRAGGNVGRQWLSSRDDWTATDCFIAASYCSTRGRLDRTGVLMSEALFLYRQACLTAPRLHHMCGLARAAAALEDDALVAEAVEALARSFPDRLPALLTMSQVLLRRDPERALVVARRALDRDRDSADLQVNLAIVEWTSGQRTDAESRLERVLTANPDHRGALGAAATVARHDGDLGRARDLLERALETAPTSLPLAKVAGGAVDEGMGSVVVHSAPRPDLALDLVEILVELEEPEAAMALLARCRGLLPAFDEPRAGIAQALLHGGRAPEARTMLAPVVATQCEDPLVWLVWAKVCNEGRDYDTALQAAERAAALAPSDPQSHYVHAAVLYNLERLEPAAMAMEAAVELDPASETLSRMLVQIRTAQRDVKGVILEVERLAAALFASGDPSRAAGVLAPYLKMPPPAILPGAESIGERLRTAHDRYREAARR